jgi:RNA polymerase sigma factor (sigma-70 family)
MNHKRNRRITMRTNEELIMDYRAGKSGALNELAKQNRGLIMSVAKRWCKNTWQSRRNHLGDTFQECSLAFLLAAHSFDLSRKLKFSTYVYVAMNRHMKNVVIYREAAKRKANMEPLTDIIGESLKCNLPLPTDVVAHRLDAESYLKRIPKSRTRNVVWLRMQGHTFPEIGRRLGVSLERARQIVVDGMQTLGCYD